MISRIEKFLSPGRSDRIEDDAGFLIDKPEGDILLLDIGATLVHHLNNQPFSGLDPGDHHISSGAINTRAGRCLKHLLPPTLPPNPPAPSYSASLVSGRR